MQQEIRFCAAPDGVTLAYATVGSGPGTPLVRVATWLTHLERDAAIYAHWFDELGRGRPFVRYDMRGCGLSDRDAADLSLTARVADLATVLDAAGLERVDLLGLSGGAAVAIAYAVRHPERVRRLVLYGGYARGRGRRPHTAAEREQDALLVSLTRVGWGLETPAFRRVFTTLFMPDADEREVGEYEDMQRVSASPETAARIRETSAEIDVSDLARDVRAATLVVHVRDDGVTPFEEGRRMATLIPGARFVPLDGRNHILLARDPAWHRLVAAVREFLDDVRAGPDPLAGLTARERAVLALVAQGLGNDEIGDRLGLSVRTVERHISHLYRKLGLAGGSARAAAAAVFLRSG
ncbi:alpha/beta fold hydrolase [Actinotalea sp. M2MS4P-6]|uniref:alpha/beta fold hydrolase n=1 Tax=Actinotalea sp. M2MS4P-6 TaxID=2983762 RepID=UPI0021E503DA|nr:alpha/beta fold hydrolase [Actinotalea sp. M2MS4P-6]MCV2394840.1 alpha/beta fold hydrolase [Actinotalea sp. M2MS4P-6]